MNADKAQFPPVITVDGPSGAGKGTLSLLLARKLGYHLLDSGALYRLVALATRKQNIDINDEAAVTLAATTLDVTFTTDGDRASILLQGEDVTGAIREEDISLRASVIAAYPLVRAALLARQRDFRQAPGLVADGRDMGTVVFPDAQVKIFLTASAEARADRRFRQLRETGQTVDRQALVEDIRQRDERDSQRPVSPLVPADDAEVLDSTDLTIEQVLDAMLALVAKQLP